MDGVFHLSNSMQMNWSCLALLSAAAAAAWWQRRWIIWLFSFSASGALDSALDFNHFAATSTQSVSCELIGLCSGEFTSIKSSDHSDQLKSTLASSSDVRSDLLSRDDFLKAADDFTFESVSTAGGRWWLLLSDSRIVKEKEALWLMGTFKRSIVSFCYGAWSPSYFTQIQEWQPVIIVSIVMYA